MHKALRYRVSIVVCGGALGSIGLSSMLSGPIDLVSILLTIGGFGMAGSAVYESVAASDASETVPDDRTVWFTTAMAVIVVIAGIWAVVVS